MVAHLNYTDTRPDRGDSKVNVYLHDNVNYAVNCSESSRKRAKSVGYSTEKENRFNAPILIFNGFTNGTSTPE